MDKPTKKLTLLFLRRGNEVLLAMKKRGFGAGRWNGVGGKLEAGETVEQALIRETQEEIGVTPKVYDKVADLHFDELFKGESTLMNVHVYVATEWEDEPTESEEMKPQWFALDQIPYDDMWPDDPYWLPQVLDGKKISANFALDGEDAIIEHSVTEVNDLL